MFKFLILFIVASASFIADLFSKTWALETLQKQTIVVNDFLNWHLAFNHGAAFSFLANESGWQKYFFIVIAILISIYLIFSLFKEGGLGSAFASGLIIGGAMGNVYDRFVYGYVIDFIDFHYKNMHYPTFNIADICICIGAILMIILNMKKL